MGDNALQRLHEAGQSIWLDYIDRTMLHNGDLQRRIRDDALTGMTSNPSIFEKALAEGTAYDAQIKSEDGELTGMQLFEKIATTDVRDACDAFKAVHERTHGADGFVSIEVSPGAAHDARATVAEGTRLWKAVARPNVMIKVPGTGEGAVAVRQLTAAGVNVNITLLFAIDAYESVMEAYMAGLEDRVAAGQDISRIHSVASFFVSRVDTEVDKRLTAAASTHPANEQTLKSLRGKAAIANARMAYRRFQDNLASARWKALAAKGATVQRPLWASTSTKNPEYRDVMYVEQLIGPDTVNTMPPQTIEAFRDHGTVERTADAHLDDARRELQALEQNGISMRAVTDKLLVDGLASFQKAFETLLVGLQKKTASLGRQLVASR